MGLLRDLWYGPTVTRADFPNMSPPSTYTTGMEMVAGTYPGSASVGPLTGRELLEIPAISGTLDLLASVISDFPVVVMDGDREDPVASAELPVIVNPDPAASSRSQWIYDTVFNLGLYGRVDWRRYYHEADPELALSLMLLDPSEVQRQWDSTLRLYREVYWRGQRQPADSMVELYMMRLAAEPMGTGPLQLAAPAMHGLRSALDRLRSLSQDSSIPPGYLKNPGNLTPERAQEHIDQWNRKHQGNESTGITYGGTEFVDVQLDNRSAQWIEAQQEGVLNIGRMFHMPDKLINAAVSGSSLTYQNVTQVAVDLERFALQPFLRRLQAAWSSALPTGFSVKLDTTAYTKADMMTRFQAYQMAVGEPWLPVEHVQEIEGVGTGGRARMNQLEASTDE